MLITILLFGQSGILFCDEKASHTVTVTVNAINEVAITGGNVSLNISTTSASSDTNMATDNTCDLNWTTNQSSQKITVATNLASPNFTLSVAAQNVTGGTTTGNVAISATAIDFVTNIGKNIGTCNLGYTAVATSARVTGSDTHSITYTITDE